MWQIHVRDMRFINLCLWEKLFGGT